MVVHTHAAPSSDVPQSCRAVVVGGDKQVVANHSQTRDSRCGGTTTERMTTKTRVGIPQLHLSIRTTRQETERGSVGVTARRRRT